MSLNQILLIGNAGRDAELRYTQSGRAVANFSIAVSRRWQVNNEWQEETEWFNVAVWGNYAENIANSIKRGNKVFVEGRLQSREYTNQAGVTRTSLDVNAYKVLNLSPREDGEQSNGYSQSGGYLEQAAQPAASGGYGGAPVEAQASSDPQDLEDLPW